MSPKFRFSAYTPEKRFCEETFTRMFIPALLVIMKYWKPPDVYQREKAGQMCYIHARRQISLDLGHRTYR